MILKVLKKLTGNLFSYFYNKNEEIYSFISFLLFMRIMQICLDIKEFNYLLISLLFAAGLLIYFFFSHALKKRFFKFIFISVITSGLYEAYRIRKPVLSFIDLWFIDNYRQINTFISNGKPTFFQQYIPFFIVLIPLLSAAVKLLHSKSMEYIEVLFIIICLFLMWYLRYDYYIKDYLLVFLLLIAGLAADFNYKRNTAHFQRKSGGINVKRDNVIPLALIMCILTVSLSGLFIKYIGIRSLPDMLSAARQEKREKGVDAAYSISYSGYSGTNRALGGPVELSRDIAFRVESKDAYYLRGSVKDYYNGFIWSGSENDTNIFELNTDEESKAEVINDKLNNKLKVQAEKRELTIFPEGISTSTLFIPNIAYALDLKGEKYAREMDGALITFEGGNVTEPYTVYFYDSPLLNFKSASIYMQGFNELPQNFDEQYHRYMQLPDNLSPDIYKLTDNITENCSGYEKLNKIYEYLHNNYQYTLDVSAVPKNREFLDYFLFTEKKGYCTYFATASTIMCRIAGIPAKMVEGFKMENYKDEDGLYVVTDDMAHAWTEVLVSPEYNVWAILDCVPAVYAENTESRAVRAFEDSGRVKAAKNQYLKRDINKYRSEDGKYARKIFINPLIPGAALFIFIFLYSIYKIIKYRNYESYLVNYGSVIPLYQHARMRLRVIGILEPESNDDDIWIGNMNDEELKKYMRELIDAVYMEFYGNKKIDGFDKKRYYVYLERYIKMHQNLIIYYFRKYLRFPFIKGTNLNRK